MYVSAPHTTILTPNQPYIYLKTSHTQTHTNTVEMASVSSVKTLVRAGINTYARDGKGKTVREILEGVEASGVIERLQMALEKEE